VGDEQFVDVPAHLIKAEHGQLPGAAVIAA
jgi:hypothetical protein